MIRMTPAGAEILVNTTTAQQQYRPEIAPNPTGGGWWIEWAHYFSASQSALLATFGQQFGSDGVPVGDAQTLLYGIAEATSGTAGSNRDIDLSVGAMLQPVLAYTEMPFGAGDNGSLHLQIGDLTAPIVSPNGELNYDLRSPFGAVSVVTTSQGYLVFVEETAKLPPEFIGGPEVRDLQVVQYFYAGDGNSAPTRTVISPADNQVLFTSFGVQNASFDQFDTVPSNNAMQLVHAPGASELTVVAWTRIDGNTTFAGRPVFSIVTADGAVATTMTDVAEEGSFRAIVPTRDGGFAILYTAPVGSFGFINYYAKHFTAAGVEDRGEEYLGSLFGQYARLVAYADGYILVEGRETSAPGFYRFFGTVLDSDFTPVAPEQVLYEGVVQPATLDVAVVEDNLVLVYHDNGSVGADTEGGAIAQLVIKLEGNDLETGTADDDFFDGGWGDDTLDGGAGIDTLAGGEGDDTLIGGTEADFLLGGAGDDTYGVDDTFDLVDEGVIFPTYGFGGFDTIVSTANWFWDVYSVGERMTLAANASDPSDAGTTMVGSVFNNEMIGNAKTNILFGRGGADTYRPGDGIDFISLSLLGLTEENAYVGVNGANMIVVEQRQRGPVSYDIVFEFESGKDKLDVSDYNYASTAEVLARGFDDGAGNSYFALGDGFDYLYMVGLTKAQIAATDFII